MGVDQKSAGRISRVSRFAKQSMRESEKPEPQLRDKGRCGDQELMDVIVSGAA